MRGIFCRHFTFLVHDQHVNARASEFGALASSGPLFSSKTRLRHRSSSFDRRGECPWGRHRRQHRALVMPGRETGVRSLVYQQRQCAQPYASKMCNR
jgi:hypothetical protein